MYPDTERYLKGWVLPWGIAVAVALTVGYSLTHRTPITSEDRAQSKLEVAGSVPSEVDIRLRTAMTGYVMMFSGGTTAVVVGHPTPDLIQFRYCPEESGHHEHRVDELKTLLGAVFRPSDDSYKSMLAAWATSACGAM